MMKKIRKLIALDFDHTIINANSDTEVYKLAPGGVIPEELKKLYKTSGWTHYMGEVFKLLHKNNTTKDDLLKCMKSIPLTQGMEELFTGVNLESTDFIIISDSNTIFIKWILEHYNLLQYFDKIYSNYAEFDSDNCLKLQKYHEQNWCSLSTDNLCKGHILTKYVLARKDEGISYSHIAYVGDGQNDFCPSLRLQDQDFVFPRNGYNLIKTIPQMEIEKNLKLKAQVCPWNTGNDILKKLLPLYEGNDESAPQEPRLYDPGNLIFS